MKTKIFTMLFAIVVSTSTFAKVKIGDLYYSLNSTKYTASVQAENYGSLTNYSGLEVANIPSTVTYEGETYVVKEIGAFTFQYCTTLKTVTFADGIKEIRDGTFCDCTALTSVTLPSSMKSIGQKAFEDCSSLSSIIIPENVNEIDWLAFLRCENLESVTMKSNALVGKDYLQTQTFEELFGPQVKHYILSEGITSIGESVFAGCDSVISISLPSTLESIGDYAFYLCKSLPSIVLPNSVTSIGYAAFEDCAQLTSVNIPNGITELSGTFAGCVNLSSIAIPNSVTYIGYYTFSGCPIISLTIPNGVTYVGGNAFAGCTALTSMTIPQGVTYIGEQAFEGCSNLTSIVLPSSVDYLSDYLFAGCAKLNSITIPNSVEYIGMGVFEDCTGLTSIDIPELVAQIQEGAFANCVNLTSVTCRATTPPHMGPYEGESSAGSDYDYGRAFAYVPCGDIPLYVPAESVELYEEAEQWRDFNPIQPIGSVVTKTYIISFYNWDGEGLLNLQVEEGKLPVYTGETPTRPDDGEYTYSFSGWTPEIVPAIANASYTATYEATPLSEGIEDIRADAATPIKVMLDGNIYIIRENKAYTLQGAEVK